MNGKILITITFFLLTLSGQSLAQSTGGGGGVGPDLSAHRFQFDSFDLPSGKLLIENLNQEVISEISIQGEGFSRLQLSEIASAQNDKGEILLVEELIYTVNRYKKSEKKPVILDIELKDGSVIDILYDRVEDIERLRWH